MKKLYKFLSLGALFLSSSIWAQCISPSAFGAATVASTGTTNLTTCAYGGEYSTATFTATGSYIFNGTGGAGNYITITNAVNLVLAHGWAPLGYVVPSTGVYRVHVSVNSACATESACHTISVAGAVFCNSPSQYGGASIATTGTTNITSCNYGGEFSVNTFNSTGIYTITATGGTGNYLTVKNVAGTIVYAQGLSPLSFNVPATGIYRIHLATTAPPACGTDFSCHNVNAIAPTATVGPTAPPNDLCVNAITLAIPSTTAGTTVNATLEAPAPPTCITTLGQPGVWYKVVGNGNRLGADLCTTSSWDSKIFVYTGTCGSWTCVTGNDDGGPLCGGAAASATWCSVPGVNYYILATGYSGPSAFNIAITQTVVAQPTVVVSASSTSICAGASTTLTASGASTYLWGGALGTTAAINVTPAATTIYTVTGTGGACTIPNVNTFTVTVNASPTITVNSGAVCAGTSFTMAPSGGITYSYTGGSAVVTPTANTSYTVTSANASGCIGSAVSSVTVNPLPLVVVNSGAICAGNSFTMAPTGATSYTYSSGSAVVSPTANTTYTVTGESVGCVTTSSAVSTVTVNALPTLTVNSGVICTGGSFTITPSGASTYTYSGGSAVVSPTANASYTVTGTSTLGCVGSSVSSVTVGTIPTITVNNGTICSGYSFTMVPSGASTYTYSSGSAVVSPTANASYTVTGTSALGCAASNTAVSSVTVNASPEISASTSTSLICVGESAVLTASTAATTYTWNSGATTLTLSVSPTVTTTYSVSTTGSNGCVGNANVTVNVNACTSINEMYVNSISVYPNPNTGILNINLTSELAHNSTLEVYDALGKLVVKHSLDNELNTLNISNLTNGIYTFKVLNNSNLVKVGKLIKQ
jgi:hypothetical protein